MRYLFVTGEGIGNVVEALPAIKTIQQYTGAKVDLLLVNTKFPTDVLKLKCYTLDDVDDAFIQRYDGKLMTIWGYFHTQNHTILNKLPTKNVVVKRQDMRLDMSEVRVYLRIAEDLGCPKSRFIYDVSDLFRTCKFGEYYNVVFCDGFNHDVNSNHWDVKSYSHHGEVAERLMQSSYDCCSVGVAGEHVDHTIDRTGLSLRESIEIIARSDLVITNDTGVYHIASGLRKPTIVIFTFTSVIKNYDSRFHKTARVLRRKDLECMVLCHQDRKWKSCKSTICQDLSPDVVIKNAEEMIDSHED